MGRTLECLMVPETQRVGNDNYGRDVVAQRRPLSLDAVMDGQARKSDCKFFELPGEILDEIVDYLDGDRRALASLALVNSDCLFLARTRQFAEVTFDYSVRAQRLIRHLGREAARYNSRKVADPKFPIGVCIRKVTYKTKYKCLARFHKDLFRCAYEGDMAFGLKYVGQGQVLLDKATAHYKSVRYTLFTALLTAAPNIEVLDWEDPLVSSMAFFGYISHYPAQRLSLSKLRIHKPYRIEPPLFPEVLPLRFLYLDVDQEPTYSETQGWDAPYSEREMRGALEVDSPVSAFFETLFRRCCNTLESLDWTNEGRSYKDGVRICLGESPPSFPLLRCLRLNSLSVHPRTLSNFFASPLKHLELSECNLENLAPYFAQCDKLPRLESLSIPELAKETVASQHMTEFIKKNNHVRKLLLHEPRRYRDNVNQLDLHIIPLLGEVAFNNLRTLSLSWGGQHLRGVLAPGKSGIPDVALATIGRLESLEQLCLACGPVCMWTYHWAIDHNELRQLLCPLTKLKMLVLRGDTYVTAENARNDYLVETYYTRQYVTKAEVIDSQTRPDLDADETFAIEAEEGLLNETQLATAQGGMIPASIWNPSNVWEQAHRNRMLNEAEAYREIFPALEWMFCGQRPMEFKIENGRIKAMPLTRDRDDCQTFIDRTFGVQMEAK